MNSSRCHIAGFLSSASLALLLFAAGSTAAFADGKIFRSAVVAGPLSTPDQRALIHFSNGLEQLVIETSLVGTGTNFAWVVPLPAEPDIKPVSTNFFRKLSQTFQPHVVHKGSSAWIFGLLFWSMLAVGIGAHRKKISFLYSLFIFAALSLVFVVLILPSFVKARQGGRASQDSEIEVRSRARVGVYDTTVIKGESGVSLLNWLNREGFSTPTNALSVIDQYASEGWVFAAAKLHRPKSDSAEHRPHPLAFTFTTERPIYPLRLTGIDNGDCAIELFVFGNRRAQAERFSTEFCGAVREYEPRWEDLIVGPPRFSIGSKEVQRFALPAVVGTKLTGKLSQKDMRSDVTITWTEFSETIPTIYGQTAAATRALTWFIAPFATGMLIMQMLGPGLNRRRRLSIAFFTLIVALAFGLGFYVIADVRPTRTTATSRYTAMNDFRQFNGAIEQFALDRNSAHPLTFDELTREVPKYIKGQLPLKNVFTGKPLRNEATAGNITLENHTNEVHVIWFDVLEDPRQIAVFTNSP